MPESADTRDRTRDLQIFSLTLSQLSYIGEVPGRPRVRNGRGAQRLAEIKNYPWRDLNPQSSDS